MILFFIYFIFYSFYLKIARFLPPRTLFAHRCDQSFKVFDGLEAGNSASSGD